MDSPKRRRFWFLVSITGAAVLYLYISALVTLSVPRATESPVASVKHVWTKTDSLAYARDRVFDNAQKEFVCLKKLWAKESAWNPRAHNPERVMGKRAGGIPQLLGMSPTTPPTIQIDRGLNYVYFRYVTACRAWQHWRSKGWY